MCRGFMTITFTFTLTREISWHFYVNYIFQKDILKLNVEKQRKAMGDSKAEQVSNRYVFHSLCSTINIFYHSLVVTIPWYFNSLNSVWSMSICYGKLHQFTTAERRMLRFLALLDCVSRANAVARASVVRTSSVSQLPLNLMHGFLSNFICVFS